MTTIPGTNVAAPIVPFDDQDTFPTHKALYGYGGWREVANSSERDALPTDRLSIGCVTVTRDTMLPWQWNGSAWVALTTSLKGFRAVGGTPGRKPLVSEVLFSALMETNDKLLATLPNGLLACAIAPTADWTITLKKGATTIGTGTILASSVTGTWTFAADVTFTAGDFFSGTAPSPQDVTLSGVAYTILGTRVT